MFWLPRAHAPERIASPPKPTEAGETSARVEVDRVGVDGVPARAVAAGGAEAGHLEDEATVVAVGREGPQVGGEGRGRAPADAAVRSVGHAAALQEDVVAAAAEVFGPEAPAPAVVEAARLTGVAAAGEDRHPGRDGPGDAAVGVDAGVAARLVLGEAQEGTVARRVPGGAAVVLEAEDAAGVGAAGGVGRGVEAVGAVVAGAEQHLVVGGVGVGGGVERQRKRADEQQGSDTKADTRHGGLLRRAGTGRCGEPAARAHQPALRGAWRAWRLRCARAQRRWARWRSALAVGRRWRARRALAQRLAMLARRATQRALPWRLARCLALAQRPALPSAAP